MDIPKLDQLSFREASTIKEWLKNVNSGKVIVPKDFNWIGLADRAAFMARKLDRFNENNLIWAKIAVEIYEKLAQNNLGEESFQRSAIMLKAHLIIKVGSHIDPDFLSIDRIIDWFFNNLEISYDEILNKIEYWQKHSKSKEQILDNLEEVKKMRKIKIRLKVIKLLADADKILINQELKNWISLFDKLP